ncbi:serine hydrolase domain-containing protein [Polaribacter ponticola]|uniref:Serine hydrolase n=1 Tax=Polaribacter ponticola TaxID=2978475 RepID=A0ABT5S6N0_9FLAO|nr:serine hydrolase domain-containing protein [Polaribacter sp. MSW5]MDD7913275.1 serine hydrolase [Polaribacter sp. MSW5]
MSKNDKIIYKKSFGFADASTLRKNTKNTIFSVASVTKPLTAVGIMKLIEDDKLSLNTPISTFFPNFIPDYSPKITIRHLLNHSSGMQANIGRIDNEGNGLMPGENLVTLNNLFEKFKDSKLKHEPGKGFEYNNFGYTLLAYIIEDISKMSYAAYMEQAVFKPASMKNTSVNNYKVVRKKAFPHIGLGMHSFTKIRSKIHSSWLKGAGNINSTSLDLQRFMRALENGILLKPSSVEKLFNYTQSRGVNDSEYGLGWRIQNKDGEKWINHTGLLPGVTSIIGMLPEKNIKIVILTNATTTDLITESNFQGKNQFIDGEIIDKLITIIQGNKVELLPKSIKTKKIVDYSNKFKLDNKHSLVLKKQGDLYTLEATGKEPWSVFTYKFSKDANENNKTSETALFFANAMSSQNFDGLTTYGDKKMKEFLGSKEGINQLKGMWAYFLKMLEILNLSTFIKLMKYQVIKRHILGFILKKKTLVLF